MPSRAHIKILMRRFFGDERAMELLRFELQHLETIGKLSRGEQTEVAEFEEMGSPVPHDSEAREIRLLLLE